MLGAGGYPRGSQGGNTEIRPCLLAIRPPGDEEAKLENTMEMLAGQTRLALLAVDMAILVGWLEDGLLVVVARGWGNTMDLEATQATQWYQGAGTANPPC